MDELELLKSHWNKDSNTIIERKMSKNDIYSMLHKNSSSILKTLFYISVFEFVLFTFLSLIPLFSDTLKKRVDTVHANTFIFNTLTIISVFVIITFVFLLHKSYKSISVTDHAKKLMENILNTIKAVNYYVIYNLVLAFVIMIVMFYQITHYDTSIANKISHLTATQWTFFVGIVVLSSFAFTLLIWGFYKLLYGKLIKRLKSNYNELLKLEEDKN